MLSLNSDLLHDILMRLCPQENINALLCTCKELHQAVSRTTSLHQRVFSGNRLLTLFQKQCLEELAGSFQTAVPDVDNGRIVCQALSRMLGITNIAVCGIPKIPSLEADYYSSADKFLSVSLIEEKQILFISSGEPFLLCSHPSDCLYVVRLSQNISQGYPDEQTPLWICFSKKERLKALKPVTAITSVALDYQLACKLDIPFLSVSKTISYQQLQPYSTIICSYNPYIRQIASLLMQFSTTPKRLIICDGTKTDFTLPFPARQRQEYTKIEQTPSVPIIPEVVTFAELCVILVGSEKKSRQIKNWLSEHIDQPRSILVQKDGIYSGSKFINYNRWIYLNPASDWNDNILQNSQPELREVKVQPQGRLSSQMVLRLRYSLKEKGVNAYTPDRLKTLCKSYGLSATGTKEKLILRLLQYDNADFNKEVHDFI